MLFSGGKVKIYDQQLNSHCHFYTDFIGSICRYTMSKLLTCWIQVKEIFIWERILRLVSMLKIWRKSLSRIWKTLKRSSRRYNFNCIIDFGQQDSRLFHFYMEFINVYYWIILLILVNEYAGFVKPEDWSNKPKYREFTLTQCVYLCCWVTTEGNNQSSLIVWFKFVACVLITINLNFQFHRAQMV